MSVVLVYKSVYSQRDRERQLVSLSRQFISKDNRQAYTESNGVRLPVYRVF